jgi:phosphatidylinositol alpha-mannosyltransferase
VLELARWLGEEGHRATVVGPGDVEREGTVLVGRARVVRANRSAAPIALGPGVWSRVAGALAGADVVHVHEPLMPAVSLAALRAGLAPVVATLHADASAMVRRGLRIGRPAVRRLLRRAAVVTAVSPVAAAVVAGAVPVRLVPNGIDTALWGGSGDGRPAKRTGSVVFVGRDDARKGLDVLLAAWPVIAARVPDASLEVIGSSRPSPAPPGVTVRGRVGEEAKRQAMGAAQVLVAPNTTGESFGIVLVEGMAARCALVASALPGFVHVGGDAARWVAPGDAGALADAVAGLLADPVTRDALVERGIGRVARFDRTPVLAGYLSAYRDALGGG